MGGHVSLAFMSRAHRSSSGTIFENRWFSPKPIKVGPVALTLGPTLLSSQEAYDADKVSEKVPGYGPGTIYTYNPLHFTEFMMSEVDSRDLIVDGDGNVQIGEDGMPLLKDKMAGFRRLLEGQAAVKQANKNNEEAVAAANSFMIKLGSKARFEPTPTPIGEGTAAAVAPNANVPEAEKNAIGLYTVRVPTTGLQLDGSHVAMVLRCFTTSAGHRAVQLLDTNAHIKPGVTIRDEDGKAANSMATPDDYHAFELMAGYQGIFAGEGCTDVGGTKANFVGLGTLPAIAQAEDVLESLRRTRPVGLARLVLARRAPAPQEIAADDILFISQMIPMWGTKTPYQNYTISRLLWSLRNTPYYKTVQAFWIVYAPKGPLAEAMWDTGARDRTLCEMALDALERGNKYRPANKPLWTNLHTARDLTAMAVLSHDDLGHVQELWRDHALKGGTGQGTAPKLIAELFVRTGAAAVSLVLKKQRELQAAQRAEVAKRTAAINALVAERKRLHPRAGTDPLALERIREIGREVDRLLNGPLPALDALWDWAELDLDAKAGPLVLVRRDPFATYFNPSFGAMALQLPELLRFKL